MACAVVTGSNLSGRWPGDPWQGAVTEDPRDFTLSADRVRRVSRRASLAADLAREFIGRSPESRWFDQASAQRGHAMGNDKAVFMRSRVYPAGNA